jgi:hypothetical protein
MKGRTVQIMAVDALNRLMDSAALKNAPPTGYDPSSAHFQSQGGPIIAPFEVWETLDDVRVYSEVGGDTAALANTFAMAINLYGELTGVLPARLGASTKSHTTAFSKDAELTRGAVRTVDYVNATGRGMVTRWLDMSYKMGRNSMKPNEPISFYIDAYGGYVEITKKFLPEKVNFEWFGSGGPQEKQQRDQSRLQSLQLALQMDQLNVQMGGKPEINISNAITEVLRDGGWVDVDVITNSANVAAGTQAAPQLSGADSGVSPAATAALQGLAGGEG